MKKNRKGQARVLSSSELDILIPNLPSEFHQMLALTLRKTGARVGEVIQLKWENLEQHEIQFPKEITKKKLDTREIPIEKSFFKLLMEWRKKWTQLKGYQPLNDDYIFYGRFRGSHITSRAFMLALKGAMNRANLGGCSSHSFRRSALSNAHKKGVPLKVIQSLSGHRNLGTLQKYLEVTDDDKREGIKAFA
tara:strand:- start:20 stop:595 length:576 start_codon:yes stop_codon:yes gene_type:complete